MKDSEGSRVLLDLRGFRSVSHQPIARQLLSLFPPSGHDRDGVCILRECRVLQEKRETADTSARL